MSLNTLILSVTRRTKNGFTVGEIFDRVRARALNSTGTEPAYSSVRARVYELANSGRLASMGVRADSVTGRAATAFRRN